MRLPSGESLLSLLEPQDDEEGVGEAGPATMSLGMGLGGIGEGSFHRCRMMSMVLRR